MMRLIYVINRYGVYILYIMCLLMDEFEEREVISSDITLSKTKPIRMVLMNCSFFYCCRYNLVFPESMQK